VITFLEGCFDETINWLEKTKLPNAAGAHTYQQINAPSEIALMLKSLKATGIIKKISDSATDQ
jgi:hypothetical protein